MTPLIPANELSAAAAVALRLDRVRREGEDQVRTALLALVDLADAIRRMCDEPSVDAAALAALRGKAAAALAANAVTPVPTVGHPLDLCRHVVAEVRDGPGDGDGIAEELRPGYFWNGHLLRPADVAVVRSPAPGGRPS